MASAGVGEATLEWHTETVMAPSRARGSSYRSGRRADPRPVAARYRARFWRGGPVLLSAMSGFEQALWDIKGKTAGLPVYELLGGACREQLLLYANHPDGLTPTSSRRTSAPPELTGVKITPFPETPIIVDSRESALRHAIDETAALRDAVGPDIRIAIDVHGRLSPAMSIVFARAVEPLDIWFLEEPALPEDPARAEGSRAERRRYPSPPASASSRARASRSSSRHARSRSRSPTSPIAAASSRAGSWPRWRSRSRSASRPITR